MNGSPLTSNSAVSGVIAAALGNGGSLSNVGPGIDFFATLKKSGNFIPVQTTPQTVASGQTPISIDWDYNNLAYIKEFPAAKWGVTIPTDGVYGGYYAQAVNATAPHPYAARLWQEFVYSDQGQLICLKGFAHPARFNDLAKPQEDPEVAAHRTAGVCALRQGEVRQHRAADEGEDARSPAQWPSEGRGLDPISTVHVAPEALRPDIVSGRRRLSLAWLAHGAVLRVHDPVPLPPGGVGAHRCVQGRDGRLDALEHPAALRSPLQRRVQDEHRGQPRHGAARRRSFGLLRSRTPPIRDGTPKWIRSGTDDLLRRRRELRRHPARVRVHRDARAARDRDRRSCADQRTTTSTAARLQRSFRKTGVEFVYLYFQLPLMILVISPAIDGVQAGVARGRPPTSAQAPWQFWRYVGLPVLMPSILGAMILLFGNAFAAYATAYSPHLRARSTSCRS